MVTKLLVTVLFGSALAPTNALLLPRLNALFPMKSWSFRSALSMALPAEEGASSPWSTPPDVAGRIKTMEPVCLYAEVTVPAVAPGPPTQEITVADLTPKLQVVNQLPLENSRIWNDLSGKSCIG